MICHTVWSILFRVLALKTLKWMFLIGSWRISTFEKVVSRPNTPNKMIHTKWKSILLCPKMMSEVVCIFVWGHLWFWKDVTCVLEYPELGWKGDNLFSLECPNANSGESRIHSGKQMHCVPTTVASNIVCAQGEPGDVCCCNLDNNNLKGRQG